jgi:hypothetical protein
MGQTVLIACFVWTMIWATIMKIYMTRENARRDALDGGRVYTMEEMKEHEDENDSAPFFRYLT